MNASRDFVNYLVRTGQVSQVEVPEDVKVKFEGDTEGQGFLQQAPGNYEPQRSRPVFQVR